MKHVLFVIIATTALASCKRDTVSPATAISPATQPSISALARTVSFVPVYNTAAPSLVTSAQAAEDISRFVDGAAEGTLRSYVLDAITLSTVAAQGAHVRVYHGMTTTGDFRVILWPVGLDGRDVSLASDARVYVSMGPLCPRACDVIAPEEATLTSSADALQLIRNYGTNAADEVFGMMLHNNVLNNLFTQSNYPGLRVYQSLQSNGERSMITVGVNAAGQSLFTTSNIYSQPYSSLCPKACDVAKF